MTGLYRITLGFLAIILLLGTLGAVSLFYARGVIESTENLYRHPFVVNNAVKNIQINLVAMHRSMKDVVLADNHRQLAAAIEKVDTYELEVFDEFNVIFDRFLGDRKTVDRAYQAFVNWREIRHSVIALVGQKKIKEAADITKGRGADHVELLNRATKELADFAHMKANEFHKRAKTVEQRALVAISLLLMLTMGASIVIAIIVIRGLARSNKENKQKAHLIDQNIMMASLDTQGNVLSASNALCRFIAEDKENIVGKPSNFFIVDEKDGEQQVAEIWRRIRSGETWEGEIVRQHDTGMTYWAVSKILPVLDESYEIVSYSNILTDTTSKKLSVTDNLTSLYNRRLFEETVEQQLKVARRQEKDLTLAILDIDFFKRYNDHYGHPKGDVALSRVGGELLKSLKRPEDYAFRIGGEEFAILFTGLDREASRRFLEEIRETIKNLGIPHESSSVADVLTVSIGAVTTAAALVPSQEELYTQADKALYLAKNTRDTVIIT